MMCCDLFDNEQIVSVCIHLHTRRVVNVDMYNRPTARIPSVLLRTTQTRRQQRGDEQRIKDVIV
jgi:hypothetical protein